MGELDWFVWVCGKFLLVLDMVSGSVVEWLYLKIGWIWVGEILDYVLMLDGMFCFIIYFYKCLVVVG